MHATLLFEQFSDILRSINHSNDAIYLLFRFFKFLTSHYVHIILIVIIYFTTFAFIYSSIHLNIMKLLFYIDYTIYHLHIFLSLLQCLRLQYLSKYLSHKFIGFFFKYLHLFSFQLLLYFSNYYHKCDIKKIY